jgi:hypothetical protein
MYAGRQRSDFTELAHLPDSEPGWLQSESKTWKGA